MQHWMRPPDTGGMALLDGVVWLGGAAALRLGVDWGLTLWPNLWLTGVLILIAPAIAATVAATLSPRLSLVLGYRLVLLTTGLLLGGRL